MYESQPNYSRYFAINIKNGVADLILNAFNESKQNIIDRVALKHRELTGTLAGFRYKREAYSHQNVKAPGFKFKPLHPSLVNEFTDHLDEWQRHEARQLSAESVIIAALNKMKTVADLYHLLPDCVHSALPDKGEDYSTLSQEAIDEFKHQHEEELKLIKLQLVLNTMKA
ncbi:hypothetical protein IT774_07475 [Salinimonas marina]|uniref:Uncharacterized protein n=1 Tax=Salinimonas marina TaxID=2785918 RepID=A0A7S9HE79_9ALTE|nr:hypothetical protein [Salinimonas marina]QPG06934.1 hypothetical protein IT774_07475 [Salinimonas marina]